MLDFRDESLRVTGPDTAPGHGCDIGEVRMLWAGEHAPRPRQRCRTIVGVQVKLARADGVEPCMTVRAMDLEPERVRHTGGDAVDVDLSDGAVGQFD